MSAQIFKTIYFYFWADKNKSFITLDILNPLYFNIYQQGRVTYKNVQWLVLLTFPKNIIHFSPELKHLLQFYFDYNYYSISISLNKNNFLIVIKTVDIVRSKK